MNNDMGNNIKTDINVDINMDKRRGMKSGAINIIFAFILLIYPLRKAFLGIDMMDAGYALGNYLFFDSINPMWKIATYLANVTGVLLSRLPGGGTWAGMNVYSSLLIGITGMTCYLFLVKRFKTPVIIFISELTALSLCWAPSVILYHYLGYILMTIAVILLFGAIKNDDVLEYIIAGVILGASVAVRMPNITYMAFIIPVWYSFWTKRRQYEDNKCFLKAAGRTALCIAGYIAGAAIPLLAITFKYGASAYPDMIRELFSMTGRATDYRPEEMVRAIVGDLAVYGCWLIPFALYALLGRAVSVFIGKWQRKRHKEETGQPLKGRPAVIYLMRLLYIAGGVVIVRLCYGRGMFGFDYAEYFSMYKWCAVYLTLVTALCAYNIIMKDIPADERLWSVFLLVIIFVTPLGSNNGIYPTINNMFLIAPVSVSLLVTRLKSTGFAVKTASYIVIFCTAFQCLMFGMCFSFHEDFNAVELCMQQGTARVEHKGASRMQYLYTKKEKALQLQQLAKYLGSEKPSADKAVFFGNIPAASYIFNLEPAVFTSWPDLESNTIEKLESDLKRLKARGMLAHSEKTADKWPIVIFGRERVSYLDAVYAEKGIWTSEHEKLKLIRQFMEDTGYRVDFENAMFIVYCH